MNQSSGGSSGFRTWLNGWSFPLMARLHALPRWVLPLSTAALLLLGLIAPPQWLLLGVLCILAVSAWVIWLVTLSWPLLTAPAPLIRVLIIALLLGATFLKATGRL